MPMKLRVSNDMIDEKKSVKYFGLAVEKAVA